MDAMSNDGQCHDPQHHNVHILNGILKCGFACRCFTFIWTLFFHMKISTSSTFNPLPLFCWDGEGPHTTRKYVFYDLIYDQVVSHGRHLWLHDYVLK